MLKKYYDALPFYEFELFQKFKDILRHAIFPRQINIENIPLLQKILDTKSPILRFNKQLHGACVWHVKNKPCFIQNGDALITQEKDTPLMIRVADCASVILVDPAKKAVANIHAGWRGLSKKVIHTTIQTMETAFSSQPSNIFAAISPMIGPCCSYFSNPKDELPKFLHKYISEENTVDLWKAAEEHLRECGLNKDHIENPRICTYCNPEEFYSYRRKNTGNQRFGVAIMLR